MKGQRISTRNILRLSLYRIEWILKNFNIICNFNSFRANTCEWNRRPLQRFKDAFGVLLTQSESGRRDKLRIDECIIPICIQKNWSKRRTRDNMTCVIYLFRFWSLGIVIRGKKPNCWAHVKTLNTLLKSDICKWLKFNASLKTCVVLNINSISFVCIWWHGFLNRANFFLLSMEFVKILDMR